MTMPVPTATAAFLLDAGGIVMSWNNACEKLLGFPAGEIIGHALGTLLVGTAPEDRGERWRGLTEDRGHTNRVLLRHADGSTVKAELSLTPQTGADGTTHFWVAAIDNVHTDATPDSVLVGRTPLAAIVDFLPGTIYAINRDGRFVLWNRNHERITGLAPEEIVATTPLELFDLQTRPLIAESIRRVFEQGEEVTVEADVIGRSGRETPMLLCGARVACNGNQYLFGMGIDISKRRRQESMLRLRERALHAASNGIVITGIDGRDCPIEYVNPAFERITGYSADEVVGRDSRFMAAPGMDVNERQQIHEAILAHRPVNVVFRNMRKNGDLFWNDLSITPVQDEHGQTTHFIGVIMDVTASKQRTAHLEHEVNHDPLTGLANRNLLWDRLEQALHMAQRQKSLVGILLIDLNNFKSINDTHGHEAGDVVLKVVARRLLASVRDCDTVARLSGDEFVLVLVNQPSLRYTLRMIERLRQGLTQPVSFMHKEIEVGASLGVAVYPHDGLTSVDLVRSADVAMYHAKATGRNEIYFFSNDMKSTTEARQRLDASMSHAIERGELFMLYQPCIDARSGKVTSFEALLRWRHPEHGVLLPSGFLAEAEENGRIVEFGAWVLDQACAFLRDLKNLGITDVPVTVNVSAREYGQHDFVANIATRLVAYGLTPGSLQIELREETVNRNPGQVRDLATQLHQLGLTLSIDEFGQGMTDLAFLRELAVGQLKLSKDAVHAIAADEPEGDGSTMARTLIDIGHNLKMPVIGEAVETRAQREFLTAHGCEALQGVLLSEPMTLEAARELVRDRVSA
ncbi:EAL domain-containing protein [Massilia sp. Leaf139]|uniref:sensor domain-containing protein n=1 Tax=Massilia sp. Leaf139 TaxID=1736272 RepID=UPI000701C3D3|nr:EAL domain-containing protein [Massilia sp. Leaf139]KQQ88928.1 diguanylate cyclase [Massilia sp. Leaf139]